MNSYSQCGEDFHIINRFSDFLPKEGGVFVDVGCADAVVNSNTYLFEKEYGYTGLCIDANPIWEQSHKTRTGSIFLNEAISSQPEEHFFICTLPELSGLDLNPDLDQEDIQKEAKTLSFVLEQNDIGEIDLLSIDVEGRELDVLKSFDINLHKPKVIIVEHCTIGKFDHSAREYLMKKFGYKQLFTTDLNHVLGKKW